MRLCSPLCKRYHRRSHVQPLVRDFRFARHQLLWKTLLHRTVPRACQAQRELTQATKACQNNHLRRSELLRARLLSYRDIFKAMGATASCKLEASQAEEIILLYSLWLLQGYCSYELRAQ